MMCQLHPLINRIGFCITTPPSHLPPLGFLLTTCQNKASSIRTYTIGERGKPYLRPLEALKKCVGLPLINGAIQGFLMQETIQDIKDLLKPNFTKIAFKKLCLTSSKTFSISILIIIPFSPFMKLE
jgi:hypothetical protein